MAAACGAHSTPWEGSAIAFWYRVIAAFLHVLTDRSVRLLAASAAGVVLADPRDELRVAAASSEFDGASSAGSSAR